MVKILLVVVALAIGSVTAASAASARTGSPAQYAPNPLPTTTEAGVSPVNESRGTGDGSLVTTGTDSLTWAGRGLALVIVGIGTILIARRSAERSAHPDQA